MNSVVGFRAESAIANGLNITVVSFLMIGKVRGRNLNRQVDLGGYLSEFKEILIMGSGDIEVSGHKARKTV